VVFDHLPEGTAAGEHLFHLRQGMRSDQEFALDFRTLAAGAGWNERALIDHYRCSLREDVRRELACRDTTLNLDQLVDLSIRLDNLLASHGRLDRGPPVPLPSTLDPTPMELGGALDSRPLGLGLIGEVTAPTAMRTRGDHEERISLFLIDSPAFPVVLSLPWLASHDPIISWQQRALKEWSCQCSGRCVGVSLGATTVESPNQVSTMHIPPEYADFDTRLL
jgi:hypothetical protein